MNKQLLLSLITGCVLTLPALGQNDGYQKFHFGLKFSSAYSWLKVEGAEIESDGGRFGIAYGLITEFAISKNYAFATGVDVSYRSGKLAGIDGNGKFSGIQKLQYVEIPVGLKLKTNEIGYITYYGQFGVLPGLLVKAREDRDYESTLTDISDKGNQSKFYPINAHLNVGAGIEYNLGGSTAFTVGLRYNNGLIDIYKGSNNESLQFRTDGVVMDIGVFF